METLLVEERDGVGWVRLNRPDVRNAFNGQMIEELMSVLRDPPDSWRAVVLTGEGKAFCAGADLTWMMQAAQEGAEGNARGAREMSRLFQVIDEAPRAVIAAVNGPAMGGALGIIAACDVVFAVDAVKFGFTEVRLGLVPAVISPFVVRKIGQSAARRYFITGEKFTAEVARDLGLVHEVVDPDYLTPRVEELLEEMNQNGPRAMGEAKRLVRKVTRLPGEEAADYAAEAIARLRASPEAQEGLAAFLEKRAPSWPR